VVANGTTGGFASWRGVDRIELHRFWGGGLGQNDRPLSVLAIGSPALAPVPGGGVLLAFRRPAFTGTLEAYRYSPDGAVVWSNTLQTLNTAGNVQTCVDGSGGGYFVWEDTRNAAAADIYGAHATSSGSLASGWIAEGLPLCAAVGAQTEPTAVPTPLGGAYFSWFDQRAPTKGVFSLRVTGTGAPESGWDPGGNAICQTTGDRTNLRTFGDGTGGLILVWGDLRGTGQDIYAQRVVADIATPVELSLSSATAEPGLARLEWFTPDGPSLSATVYRRESESDPWLPLGAVSADGAGHLAYEDRTVVGGHRYGYRLGYLDGGREAYTPEVWLEIPVAYAFALERVRPNPVKDAMEVSFTLARAGRAKVELYDVSGRRVEAAEVEAAAPGRFVRRMGEGRRLEAGIYIVRLTHAGRSLTTRACVVR
jgi:hypothetical protein